jgi:hypothetical protein
MAEKSGESPVGKYLGAPIGGALAALLTWVTAGSRGALSPALISLLAVAGGLCGFALTLVYRRYLGILGADRRRPAERQAYDALRESLAEGNIAARLYAERLTRFLDWVERFFGDAGTANRTLFPRAFGLRTPAPLWTAPALDRCLLLALFYPIFTIFVIWAVSGHVGPAEAALRLSPDLPAWQRAGAAVGVGFMLIIAWYARPRYARLRLWKVVTAYLAAFTVAAISGAGVIVNAAAVMCNLAPWRFDVTGSGTGAVFYAVFFSLLLGVPGIREGGIVFPLAVLAVMTITFLGVVQLGDLAIKRQRQGGFIAVFFATTILACLAAAYLSSPLEAWKISSGPMLLFLGLLTLLNAPFDWASLGLTRALLRRGLELGGWWPYVLAIVDAALAVAIIAALGLTMVVGVQAFDGLAEHGGGTPVLPLDALFNHMAAHPSAPEYWWLYALLLSTMIPSLVNLVIGGTSLVRGLPGVPSLLLPFIRKGVLKWDRHWIATVLTAQVAAGAALGIAAQAFLVIVILGYVMPFFGLELLDMARDVAAFNLPARVGQLFGSVL